MIELLVLIAIATIGVIYTSSTGEAESTAMAEKTAKEALNEAEGSTGIGILGIDVVARKMRDLVGKSDGAAVTADTLAEFRGVSADDADDIDAEDDDQEGEPRSALEEMWDEDEEGDDWSDAAAAEEDWDEDEEGDDWSDPAKIAKAREDLAREELAREEAAREKLLREKMAQEDEARLDEDWSSAVDDGDDEDDLMEAPQPAQPAAERVAAKAPEAPKVPPVLDTADAPIVEDFDPEYDELQIGYCPGEAGNGRIGIAEDPLRPGSAAVTLGGRCVAVVLNGYGKVRAHHIDLICQEEDDMAA
ncbi:hypothetical protein [Pseudooceanicola sp. MF1-13]|uniref:hypothetical protein n=1 Tax=Pseudooceanicola sp. MF1-13 TaxID=3379095 RepID=UPI00389250EA